VASLAKVVASVAQIASRNTNVNVLRDLERDSQTLDRIRDSFRRILGTRTLKIWSFVEEFSISGVGRVRIPYERVYCELIEVFIDQVVHGDSAIIDYSRETRGTIHADHIGMTKFSTRVDPGYRKVLYAIEMVLEEDASATVNQSMYTFVYNPYVQAFIITLC
jgi:hypothetical protein